MAAVAEDHARRWEPFGVTESDFAAAPGRDTGVSFTAGLARNPDPTTPAPSIARKIASESVVPRREG